MFLSRTGEVCGIISWLSVPFYVIAQIDHKNGDKKNNSTQNLRLICPFCHSHTITRFKKAEILNSSSDFLINQISDLESVEKRYKIQCGLVKPKYKKSLEEIFNGKHSSYKPSRIIDRMIAEGKKQACCENCGIKQ